jgi:bifunctional DNA-binding transcriptional regulator/antitoxin component of YhaV-PrlF toxin-antitoxin module
MANKSTLQYPNNTQFMVTVPKGLVLAKGWKRGDKLEFVINNKGEIVMRKSKK